MSFDAARARECARLGRARDGGSPISDGSLIPACAEILVGTAPLGVACSAHEECAGGYCRPAGLASCEGVCAAPLSARTLCEPLRDICAAGLDCREDPDTRAWRCLARGPAGALCRSSGDFDSSLVCASGRCRAPLGEGERCSDAAPCGGELVCAGGGVARACRKRARRDEACDPNAILAPTCESRCLVCDPRRSVCVALGGSGAACSHDTDCLGVFSCSAGRVCVPKPKSGEPCTGPCLYAGDACRREHPSDAAGICTPELCAQPGAPERLPGAGERCTHDGLCNGAAYCQDVEGTLRLCRQKKAAGATCSEDHQCSMGNCERNSKRCAAVCANGCIGNFLSYYGYLVFFAGLLRVRARSRRTSPGPRPRSGGQP
jgi:hypothetical protein